MSTTTGQQGFDSWALVELMGHQRIAGHITEQQIGGSAFVRVDVPESEGMQSLTKFLGPSSIYAITPVSEETARALAKRIQAVPLSVWDAQRLAASMSKDAGKQLTGTVEPDEDDEEDEL